MAESGLLQTTIYADLRDRMLAGEMAAGVQLSEQQLADEFKASRMPVRHALAKLAHEGMIEQSSRVRSSVIDPTLADLQESLEVRCLLEPYAARLAAPRLSWVDLETLEKVCAQSQEVAEEVGRRKKFLAIHRKAELHADITFHRVIWRAADRPRMTRLCEDLHLIWRIGSPLRAPIDALIESLAQAAHFHRQILDALKQRDDSAAAEHMRRHVESNRAGLTRMARAVNGV